MNNRRKFFIALGAGALTSPFASFAQQQDRVSHIGFLTIRPGMTLREEAFLKGLQEFGG